MSASTSSSSKTFIKYGLLCWVLQRSPCIAHILYEFVVQEEKWRGMGLKWEKLTRQLGNLKVKAKKEEQSWIWEQSIKQTG